VFLFRSRRFSFDGDWRIASRHLNVCAHDEIGLTRDSNDALVFVCREKIRDANMKSLKRMTRNTNQPGGTHVSDAAVVVAGRGADLISIGEVSEILAVSKSTASRIAASGSGFPKPYTLNPKTKKYSRVEVLAWLVSKKG
jgi:predicted DNA-binding transcriptional regulator AlpA